MGCEVFGVWISVGDISWYRRKATTKDNLGIRQEIAWIVRIANGAPAASRWYTSVGVCQEHRIDVWCLRCEVGDGHDRSELCWKQIIGGRGRGQAVFGGQLRSNKADSSKLMAAAAAVRAASIGSKLKRLGGHTWVDC